MISTLSEAVVVTMLESILRSLPGTPRVPRNRYLSDTASNMTPTLLRIADRRRKVREILFGGTPPLPLPRTRPGLRRWTAIFLLRAHVPSIFAVPIVGIDFTAAIALFTSAAKCNPAVTDALILTEDVLNSKTTTDTTCLVVIIQTRIAKI